MPWSIRAGAVTKTALRSSEPSPFYLSRGCIVHVLPSCHLGDFHAHSLQGGTETTETDTGTDTGTTDTGTTDTGTDTGTYGHAKDAEVRVSVMMRLDQRSTQTTPPMRKIRLARQRWSHASTRPRGDHGCDRWCVRMRQSPAMRGGGHHWPCALPPAIDGSQQWNIRYPTRR